MRSWSLSQSSTIGGSTDACIKPDNKNAPRQMCCGCYKVQYLSRDRCTRHTMEQLPISLPAYFCAFDKHSTPHNLRAFLSSLSSLRDFGGRDWPWPIKIRPWRFFHDWPWPIIKTCHPHLFVSFPAKKGLIDQSPQTGRRPIGKTISSSEPVGIVGLYYVLELSEVCF